MESFYFKKSLKALAGFSLAILSLCLSQLSGCTGEAQIASHNIAAAADNFEIQRHIVFYNSTTNTYMLEIVGLCSIEHGGQERKLSVTCKTGPKEFKKHILGLSESTSYFMEQIDANPASVYNYRVVWKPLSLIPDIEPRR